MSFEIGDVLEIVDRLVEIGVIAPKDIERGRARKKGQLEKFMQFEKGE